MTELDIDIETFSSADLKKTGVYRYIQAPDFTILLFAYSFDDEPIKVVDLAQGEQIPEEVLDALLDHEILKTAHNANFERSCIGQYLKMSLPVEQWECTMARASQLGLPLSLDLAAKALKLGVEKSASGKALIKYFTVPCKPTKANGGRTRNLPQDAPEKWEQFKEYNRQDVVVEKAIRNKIQYFRVPESEKLLWQLDQKINDTGILLDPEFVRNAMRMDTVCREKLTREAVDITGLDNPNSVSQLKKWLLDSTGIEVPSLSKDIIPWLKDQNKCETVNRVLAIRQEMSKSSIKKYGAMVKSVCLDNRVRGLFQYYGANRTGRWAGRLVQMQNLPKNELSDLDLARRLVKEDDLETLELLYDSIPDTLSQLIRTSFVAPPEHRFIVADFSAIEARIQAWLSQEKWRLDVFTTHGKIYEASAAQMFKVPIENVTKGSTLRQKGKMSELALGYQGGPNAIIKIEVSNKTPPEKRIPVEELPRLVAMWRRASPRIVNYWYKLEEAAIDTVRTGESHTVFPNIRFLTEKGILFIQLPSGRRLSYLRPKLRPGDFGCDALIYEGMNQTTKQWGRQDTYGGKLFENLCQAIARDVLADAMLRLDKAGYQIPLHVHDEAVLEMPYGKGSKEEVNKIMSEPIAWAKNLPLRAESYETEYYKKD
jgi:DNA polymerase